MSFLWYWPAGGWNFDSWKSRQKWEKIKTQQSGDPKLHALISPDETLAGWEREKKYWKGISDQILGTLSDVPPGKVTVEWLGVGMVRGGHSVRRVRYLLTASEWGYAWMLVPAQARLGKKCAAVIAHHQTSAHGKYEAAGMEVTPGEEWLAYGQELAERGYVVMAPDAIAFGERQGGHAHAKYHSADEFFAAHPQGGVMGKMAYDTSRAIDVLETLPEVDPTRIGCVGHSHGGYGTLFSMVQDDRIKAGVVSCGVTLLRADPTPQRWWRMTALMPRLGLYEGDMPSTPIDFHHWIALVAPRPLAVVVGTKDAIFPNAAPVADAIEEARKVYALYGAADKLQGQVFEGPHSLPEAQKVRAFQLLKDTLRP